MIVSVGCISMIKNADNGVVIRARTIDTDIAEFSITVDLHQGSTLSSYFFMLVIDELIGYIQDDISWYMLLVNDIVLADEIKVGVNHKLEL